MIEQSDLFDFKISEDSTSQGGLLDQDAYMCPLHSKLIEKICFHDQCKANSILLCEDCDQLFLHEQDTNFNNKNIKNLEQVKKYIDELLEKRDQQFEQMEIILLTKLTALIELQNNSDNFHQQLNVLTNIWKLIFAEKQFFLQNKYQNYLDLIFANPNIRKVSHCYDRKTNIDKLENVIRQVNRNKTIHIEKQYIEKIDKKSQMIKISDLKKKIKFSIYRNQIFQKKSFDQQNYNISLLVLYLEIGKKYGLKESQKQVMQFVGSNNFLKQSYEHVFLTEYVLLNFNEGQLYKFNEQGEYFGFYYLRAISKSNKQNYSEALQDIHYALILQSSCLELIKLKTQMNLNLQQYDNSLISAQQGLQLDPNFSLFYYYQGLSKLKQRKYNEAEILFKQAIEKEENELYYIKLGQTYQNLYLYEKALAIYSQAQEFVRQNIYKNKISEDKVFSMYQYKADCFRCMGKFQEAEDNCNIGLSEKPNDYKLLYKKGKNEQISGQIYYDQQQYKNAIELFIFSLSQKESAETFLILSIILLYSNKGFAFIENSQNDQGIYYFKKFLKTRNFHYDSKQKLIQQVQQNLNSSNLTYLEIIKLYNKNSNDCDIIKFEEYMNQQIEEKQIE